MQCGSRNSGVNRGLMMQALAQHQLGLNDSARQSVSFKAELPRVLADIWRRRIALAPPSVTLKAFGAERVRNAFWSGTYISYWAIGSRPFISQCSERHRNFGNPFPLLVTNSKEIPTLFSFENSRGCMFVDINFKVESGAVRVFGNSSVLFRRGALEGGNISYEVETAIAVTVSDPSGWVEAFADIDLLLASYIRDYVHRAGHVV